MDITLAQDGDAPRIVVAGSLNTNTAGQLEAALNPLFAEAQSLTFDFADLDYISSAGLRVLMMAYKRLGGKGVAVEHAKDDVREVFDLTGFSALLEMRP